MIRPPPRSTRTDTLFPYTTLFRSVVSNGPGRINQAFSVRSSTWPKSQLRADWADKASGAKANRTGLAEALSHAREGDVLVVWKLDRLGRTMKGLVDLAAELADRGDRKSTRLHSSH